MRGVREVEWSGCGQYCRVCTKRCATNEIINATEASRRQTVDAIVKRLMKSDRFLFQVNRSTEEVPHNGEWNGASKNGQNGQAQIKITIDSSYPEQKHSSELELFCKFVFFWTINISMHVSKVTR